MRQVATTGAIPSCPHFSGPSSLPTLFELYFVPLPCPSSPSPGTLCDPLRALIQHIYLSHMVNLTCLLTYLHVRQPDKGDCKGT